MTTPNRTIVRVLAIDPSSAGFGFAVLEDPTRLVDWGVAEVWSKSPRAFLARVEALVDRYAPSLIAVEDVGNSKTRQLAAQRISSVVRYSATRSIPAVRILRSEVKKAFGGNPTKHDISVAITEIFPELVPRLPPKRKLWESEREQMNLFDALSFALTGLARVAAVNGTAM